MALFGTDGVRGVANVDLTAELAVDLAIAAAHVLGEIGAFAGHRPKAIVGQDSRASGDFLEAAVVAGLTSAGVDVYRVGVLPTPAVAFLVKESNADLGVMISASHNPMPDNGIKFFAKGGDKLADQVEAQIEARLGFFSRSKASQGVFLVGSGRSRFGLGFKQNLGGLRRLGLLISI